MWYKLKLYWLMFKYGYFVGYYKTKYENTGNRKYLLRSEAYGQLIKEIMELHK